MAADRDLAVAFVRVRFPAPTATGWEMLAATGVRGLRLLHEGGGFRSFLFTEAHPAAAQALTVNVARFPGGSVLFQDAHRRPDDAPFDYVDLDPYGSPLPLLNTALSAVGPGGVLAVTATDLMVLAGAQPAACERLYGARPVRGRLGPEGGLRILLAAVARSAHAAHRDVRPLLAYVRGHYLRAYLEVSDVGPTGAGSVGVIDPVTWDGPVLGVGGPFGPMWLGRLSDPGLLSAMRVPVHAAAPRETAAFLDRLQGESQVDRPFYYEPNVLASALKLRTPASPRAFLEALAARGYRAARTHARPEGFRTDAPRWVVEEVARTLPGA